MPRVANNMMEATAMWDGYYLRREPPEAVAERNEQRTLASIAEGAQASIARLRSKRDNLHLGTVWDYELQVEMIEDEIREVESKARRSAIMSSMYATGRMKAMANELADSTRMSVEDAIDALKEAFYTAGMSSAPKGRTDSAPVSDALCLGGVMTRGEAAMLSGGGHSSWSELAAKTFADRRKQTKGNSK